jgi:hypothetical protein
VNIQQERVATLRRVSGRSAKLETVVFADAGRKRNFGAGRTELGNDNPQTLVRDAGKVTILASSQR